MNSVDRPAETSVFTVRPQFKRAWLARAGSLIYLPLVLALAIEVPAHAAWLPFPLPHWPWLLRAFGLTPWNWSVWRNRGGGRGATPRGMRPPWRRRTACVLAPRWSPTF